MRTGRIPGGGIPDESLMAHRAKVLGPMTRISEWEAYTREFIVKYRLDAAQERRALDVLHDCQDQAAKYAASKKEAFESLLKEEYRLAAISAEVRPAREKELAQKRADLMSPIHEIFDRQLKPRLETIPTRAQREHLDKGKEPAAMSKSP